MTHSDGQQKKGGEFAPFLPCPDFCYQPNTLWLLMASNVFLASP